MKNLKESGITLIALVITIIILLILAGVTLSLIWNGGIINKSQQAVDVQSEAQAREELSLALVEYKMKTLMEKDYNGTLDTFLSTKPDTNSDEKWVARDAEEDNNYYEVEIGEWLFWVNKGTNEIISKGKKNPVPPIALSFKASSYDVNIGEDLNLLNELNITPSNANKNLLEWTISSSEKATITNGIVHGLEETTDAITVTVKSKEDASINASCTINVKAIELTGITLPEKITVAKNKTKTIEVTYIPTNATYKDLSWKVVDNSTNIVKVANGVVTGVAVGKKTITATSTVYSGVSASCEVSVEDILEISTEQELKDFRDAVNGIGYDEHGNKITVKADSYSGKKVVLANDIKLNEGKYRTINGIVTFDSDAEEWTPIGTETNKFQGNFDGQGYTISGIYINKPTENHQAFFGYSTGISSSKSSICNLNLKDVNITGASYTSGIVGEFRQESINKCSVSGNISGTTAIGGIAGLQGAPDSKISNCYNSAIIYASDWPCGGIVGRSAGDIRNCYNAADVSGGGPCLEAGCAGGITGEASSSSGYNIINCYNIGNILGNYYAGGVIGWFRRSTSTAKIDNCHSSGNVTGTGYIGGAIGYFDSTTATVESNCSYLEGKAEKGIGRVASGTATINSSTTLPTVLSVINGDNAFTTDGSGNILLNFSN